MSEVMKIILALSLSGTVLAGALALVRRLLKNKLPQALFYYLWLLVLLRLIVPVAVPLPEGWRNHQMEAQPVPIDPAPIQTTQPVQNQLPPVTTEQWEIVLPPDPVLNNGLPMPSAPVTPETSAPVWYEQAWDFLCDWFAPIWLIGALVHFLWFALSYLRFCRRLKGNCTPLWEYEQALLDDLRGKQKVTACRSPLAGTPMLVGLVRHCIILPGEGISTRQLECILRHELTHLRRRDLLYKWFAVAATSLHWFNPFMPWLRREIARCCELSCDESVVSGMDDRQKQWYGETLLALASLHALPRAVPATTLCEEKAQLKERLLGIMKYKKATALILLLSCLLAVLIAGCAAVLGPQKPVKELPQASDYALWINAAQQDVFVRNWKVEYHNGTHVASIHMAPADYDGDEYVFRGRDLPELRARVEAWAFAELPLDRENCILYYQMEPDLLMATSAQVTVFPLDGGKTAELALPDLDMTTYCGHVTITDLRDNEQWLLVLTDADRVPQLSHQVEPLTAEEQAEVLEELRIWAEENLEKPGEITLEFDETVENPAHLGFYAMVGGTHLYDLSKREVRDVDGTYPDVEQLGVVFLSLKEGDSLKDWRAFYLTYGDPAKATPPGNALELAASDYADGTVTEVFWWQQNSLAQYIRVDFDRMGKGYAFEYSALSGRWSVKEQEKPRQEDSALKMAHLPALLESINHWQQTEGADKETYQLSYEPEFLKRTAVVDTLDQFLKDAWENRAVYDIYSEKTSRLEGNYTGSQDYGYFSLMYPAENARQWVYLVDNADPDPDLSGRVAVVLEDTPLENARVETVDSEGRTIRMDMAITLKKGDLVYVESREPGSCTVSVLAGEPPRPYGQLSPDLLSGDGRDLRQANQVILNHTEGYDNSHGTVIGTYSGVANVEHRDMAFWKVSLPGGGESFWIMERDARYSWPLKPGKEYIDSTSYYKLQQWLETQYPDQTVLDAWSADGKVILLAGITNPGAQGYQMLKAYVVRSGENPVVLASREGEPNFSAGFSAHSLTDGAITVLFGDTDDSVFDYQNDSRIPVNFTQIRVVLADGTAETFPISGDEPYLAVMAGTKQIKDVVFISGEQEYRYADFYSAQLTVSAPPETLSYTDLQNYYMNFAMDWRVDFVPDFDHNSFSGTVSSQDFLMLTWYIHRDSLPEDGSMSADLVEMVMETQFGIESIHHESLFKTWDWDAKQEKYLPVPQGVAGEGLFDTVAFLAQTQMVKGSEQTVYTVTLREYSYPFLDYGGSYADLTDYAADETAYGRENVQFLLDTKGEQLKSGQLTPEEAVRQLILEGNTSGFTKGNEIRLKYYMTGNGPRFLYKSERIFDFTPGAVYENASMGFRLTLPACWEGKYRIQEQENSVRIDDAWGGTLCTIFRRDAAQFAADGGEDSIPVPHRVLGQNGQYVWLMYFASDVQYDPGNQEQTAAYLAMDQDLESLPFEMLGAAVPKGLLVHMRQLEDGRFFLLYDQPTEVQGGRLNVTGIWVYDPQTGGLENIANVAMEGLSPERVAVKGNTVLCSWEGKSMLRFAEKNGRWQMEILPRESEDRITIAPDHLRYAQREEETVVLRDLTTHKELARLEGFRNINRMVWSSDSSKLAVLSDHAFVTVWEPAAGTTIRYQGDRPEGWVNLQTVTFANNGKQLWMDYLCETTDAISIWDLETDSLTDTFYGDDLAVMDVRDSAVLYYRLDQKALRSSLHIYDCRSGTSETVGADVLYTAACFAGDTRTVLANQYDRAKLESRLTVLQAEGTGVDEAAAQSAVLAFLAKEYPEAKAPQIQPFVINDPSQLATLQMMTTETYTYDVNTGAIAPLRQAVPDSAQLGGLFIRDESGQYRKEWMFLFTKEGPKQVIDNEMRLLQLSTRFPDAVVTDLELFVKDGLTVWSMVQLDDGSEAQTYNYSGALGAYELEKTSGSARSAGKLPLSDLPGLLSAVAAWQAGHDTQHNAVNYNLSLQTNTRAVEIMLQQSWAGIAVYDLSSGTISQLEGSYEGSLAYGCITVLGPAKSPFWLYVIDNSGKYAVEERAYVVFDDPTLPECRALVNHEYTVRNVEVPETPIKDADWDVVFYYMNGSWGNWDLQIAPEGTEEWVSLSTWTTEQQGVSINGGHCGCEAHGEQDSIGKYGVNFDNPVKGLFKMRIIQGEVVFGVWRNIPIKDNMTLLHDHSIGRSGSYPNGGNGLYVGRMEFCDGCPVSWQQ